MPYHFSLYKFHFLFFIIEISFFIFDTLNSNVGVDGIVLQDVDPSKGSFADTPAVPKGAQLKALHTKMRSMYNSLMIRVNASGSHSVGPDLILCAYERCGVENRPKDISLFFYYLTVRDKDLAFLTSVLFPEESATEFSDTLSVDTTKSETKYGKKQRVLKETAETKQSASEAKQISMMKALLVSEGDSASTQELTTSLVYKNNMAAETEQMTKRKTEIDILLSVLSNESVFSKFSKEIQEGVQEKLNKLLMNQINM